MASGNGIKGVLKKLDAFERDSYSAADIAADRTAIQLQGQARQNRRWQDETGNARRSITGTAGSDGKRIVVALAIGVFYGVYLELSNAGRYSIIQPTLREKRSLLIDNYKRTMKI